MVKIEDLSYQYPNGALIKFPDFEVRKGESLLILGESGCGKTTLLHLLAGLLKPTTGKIWVDNTLLSRMNNARIDQFRGEHIGIVFQKNYFIESLSIKDNLIISPHCTQKDRVHSIAERLGIQHIIHRYPNQVSVGQQQRACIGRAIMNLPQLLLADEPTSALDYNNCINVINILLDEATANDAALIIVSHDDRLRNEIENVIELTPTKVNR